MDTKLLDLLIEKRLEKCVQERLKNYGGEVLTGLVDKALNNALDNVGLAAAETPKVEESEEKEQATETVTVFNVDQNTLEVTIQRMDVEKLARYLNNKLINRAKDHYKKYGVGGVKTSTERSFSLILGMLQSNKGKNLLEKWENDNYDMHSRNKVLAELKDVSNGVTVKNIRLASLCTALTYHRKSKAKIKLELKLKKKETKPENKWLVLQTFGNTTLYAAPRKGKWVVTTRNVNKYGKRFWFDTLKEAEDKFLEIAVEEEKG